MIQYRSGRKFFIREVRFHTLCVHDDSGFLSTNFVSPVRADRPPRRRHVLVIVSVKIKCVPDSRAASLFQRLNWWDYIFYCAHPALCAYYYIYSISRTPLMPTRPAPLCAQTFRLSYDNDDIIPRVRNRRHNLYLTWPRCSDTAVPVTVGNRVIPILCMRKSSRPTNWIILSSSMVPDNMLQPPGRIRIFLKLVVGGRK